MRHQPDHLCHLPLFLIAALTSARPLIAQELLHTFEQPRGLYTRLTFSADDTYLAAIGGHNEEGKVFVWNSLTDKDIARLPISDAALEDIRFVPGQMRLVLFDVSHCQVVFWDFERNETRAIQVGDVDNGDVRIVSGFDISPDGELVAIGMHRRRDDDWFVRVARTSDGSVIADLEMLGLARCVYFGEDGSSLFAAEERYHRRPNSFAAYVYEWDVPSGKNVHQWGPFPMTGFKRRGGTVNYGMTHLSADGKLLASPHGDRVVVMDGASGNYAAVGPHQILPIPPGPLAGGDFGGAPPYRALAFDPSGYRLATGCIASASVYFWPLAESRSPDHLDQPGLSEVRGLKYSPSGRFLAVTGRGADGGKLHVWQLHNEPSANDR